jgi:hypothetical protein
MSHIFEFFRRAGFSIFDFRLSISAFELERWTLATFHVVGGSPLVTARL